MDQKAFIVGLSLALAIVMACSLMSPAAGQESPSNVTSAAGAQYPPYPVNLYEFYRSDCPHCQALAPHITDLEDQYPTLHVFRYEITNGENYSLFQQFQTAYGLKSDTVPTVFIGNYTPFVSDLAEPQIAAAVAQAIQNGATGPGDQITGNIVPTPTPAPNSNATNNSSARNGTFANAQGALPLPPQCAAFRRAHRRNC